MSQYKPIQHEQSEPFVFYEEHQNPIIKDENITKLLDFVVYYLLTDSNPRLKLALFGFAAGYDIGRILGVDNTQRAISKKLGVNHRQFSNMLKKIEEEFDLHCINTDKPFNSKEIYKQTNKI